MTDHTRTALDPEAAALFAEAEALLADWGRSIEWLEAIAAEMRDAAAELEEWSC